MLLDAPASGALVGVYVGVRGAPRLLPQLASPLFGHGARPLRGPRGPPPAVQALLLRHPVQGGLRQEHLRAARPHLRGLLQPLQRTAAALTMQERLLHDRLLQRLPGRAATSG